MDPDLLCHIVFLFPMPQILAHLLRMCRIHPAISPSSSETSGQPRPGLKLSTTASSAVVSSDSSLPDQQDPSGSGKMPQAQKRTTSAKMATKTEEMEMSVMPRKHSHAVGILERIDERPNIADQA